MVYGALWDQAQFVICLRRVLGTPPLEGNLVSAFLWVFRGRRMFSSWNNQMNSKALRASLFCFGLSGRKEDGKMETLELVNKEKQLYTCITLFLYLSLLSLHDHDEKMFNFHVLWET